MLLKTKKSLLYVIINWFIAWDKVTADKIHIKVSIKVKIIHLFKFFSLNMKK